MAVPTPGSTAVPTTAPATAPAGALTVTLSSGPLILSGMPTMPSTRSTASSASICRLSNRALPDALSTPEVALIRVKSISMPSGVFCVSSCPVTMSSRVCPSCARPRLRTALSRSKRSKVLGPMVKLVWVCNDCASPTASTPSAESVVVPDAWPEITGLRLKAFRALATSMPLGASFPVRCKPPLASVCTCSSPCPVPPPTFSSTAQRSCSPRRDRLRSVTG